MCGPRAGSSEQAPEALPLLQEASPQGPISSVNNLMEKQPQERRGSESSEGPPGPSSKEMTCGPRSAWRGEPAWGTWRAAWHVNPDRAPQEGCLLAMKGRP